MTRQGVLKHLSEPENRNTLSYLSWGQHREFCFLGLEVYIMVST